MTGHQGKKAPSALHIDIKAPKKPKKKKMAYNILSCHIFLPKEELPARFTERGGYARQYFGGVRPGVCFLFLLSLLVRLYQIP